MTERGVTSGAAGPVAARQPDPPSWVSPNDHPFEPPPPTAPDHVPTALLHPPATDTTADPPLRIAAADPVARRLAELDAAPPAFDVPTRGGSPAATLAAHCPDLFLISATADRRPELVADLAATAARAGQRVLVLANHPEAVFGALTGRCDVALGRAVGPDEGATGRGHESHTALAYGQRHRDILRVGLTARVAELQVRIDAEERRDKLRAEAERLTADLDRVGQLADAAVEASDELKRLVETREAGVAAVVAHTARRAEVEHELTTLKQAAQPVGFFKKLFGGAGKPEPAKVETVEAKLRELDATPPDPLAAFEIARSELLAARTHGLRTELESRLTVVRGELDQLPPAEPLDELCRAFDAATADLARLDAHPFTPPAAELDAVRVVVGPPAAVGHDPFLSDAHPEVEPRFDRVVWADAEDLTDDTFAAVARLGASWAILGTPDPLHPPGYRNGRPRAAFFSQWWERLHTVGWTHEDGRLLARLVTVAQRAELHCEPLLDRPDVEARWTTADGTPVLAEVLFPAGMTHAEAKRFLAHEAGEVRCGGCGPCEWDEAGDAIRCRWPATDAANGDRDDVDLGSGIREQIVNGTTANVTFDATTWTRDSAARWLNDRLLPPTRTAVVS